MKLSIDIANTFLGEDHFLSNLTGVGTLVSIFVSNAIVIAGLILLFLLIFGGYSMIAGAGANNPQKIGQGKQAVTAAVIGFILVFIAYWIVRIVGTATGTNLL